MRGTLIDATEEMRRITKWVGDPTDESNQHPLKGWIAPLALRRAVAKEQLKRVL